MSPAKTARCIHPRRGTSASCSISIARARCGSSDVIPVRQIAGFIALIVAGLAGAEPTPAPANLVALAAKAKIVMPLAAWCRGTLGAGTSVAYAVAIGSPTGGGKYLVLLTNGDVVELAPFTGGADLACYTPSEARTLSTSIERSATIHGAITPVWASAVTLDP